MTILRCVLFIAVSSEEQAKPGKMSLENQRADCQAFVDAIPTRYPGNSGVVVETLSIEGSRRIIQFSDAIDKHTAYARLNEMIEAGSFDVLVFARWDRLGRTESLQITIRDLCLSHGIVTAPADSPPPSLDAAILRSDEGWRVTGMIQSWGSGREVREIARRVKMGRRARVVENRQFMTRPPEPYYYVYDEKGNPHITVDEERAAIIRRILLQMYLADGLGKISIAEQLRVEGVPTINGSQWLPGTVERILKRVHVYAGQIEYGSRMAISTERYDGAHPAIISTDEALALLAERERRRSPGRPSKYAFSTIAVCGVCGSAMRGDRYVGRVASGEKRIYHYLRCRACSGSHIPEGDIYEAIEATIIYVMEQLDVAAYLAEISQDIDDGKAAEIAAAEKTLAEIQTRRARLLTLYESGTLTVAELTDRIRERESEAERLQNQLSILQRQQAEQAIATTPQERIDEIKASGLEMLARWKEEPVKVRNWLRPLIRIIVTHGEIEEIQLL